MSIVSDTTDPRNTAADSITNRIQSCSRAHTLTRMPHTRHTQTLTHISKGKTKRQTTHLRKYQSPLPPWSWGGGQGEGLRWSRVRSINQDTPKKVASPEPPTPNKGKFFCDMDDQRCVIIFIFLKPRGIIKPRRQTYIPGFSQQ